MIKRFPLPLFSSPGKKCKDCGVFLPPSANAGGNCLLYSPSPSQTPHPPLSLFLFQRSDSAGGGVFLLFPNGRKQRFLVSPSQRKIMLTELLPSCLLSLQTETCDLSPFSSPQIDFPHLLPFFRSLIAVALFSFSSFSLLRIASPSFSPLLG